MAKDSKKATEKKATKETMYKITKSSGKVIFRKEVSDVKEARLKRKGWKVEAI